MPSTTYLERRGQLLTYFDRTAVDAWSKLTSQAPVGRIRATVRAGRERMRQTLLGWLPEDLRGRRLLDAGCGTGALAIEAAHRGAAVVAIDLSPTLVGLARERTGTVARDGSVDFRVGDMLEPGPERFDHVVAMDSLIHYQAADMVGALVRLTAHADRSVLVTFAPRTMALSVMHAVGRLFPRGDRAPAIEPVAEARLRSLIAAAPALAGWRIGRTQRIVSGFYTSQALELVRA
jgi:magnesium-protoporphyrin O-methyltransferase